MPDQPFQRTIVYPLEKPLADDIDQGFSQADRSLREVAFQEFAKQTALGNSLSASNDGFIGSGLRVFPTSPASGSVVIKAGLGFQGGPTDTPSAIGGVIGLDDLSQYKPIILALDKAIVVPAAPGANSRIDIIEVAYLRQADNLQSRNFLDPATSTFSPALVAKTLDFDIDSSFAYYAAAAVPTTAIAYKSGVAAPAPVAPATDVGYLKLAEIWVNNGAVTFAQSVVEDRRRMLFAGNIAVASVRFNLRWNGGAPTVTIAGMNVPAGMDIVVWPSPAQKSRAEVLLFGGHILGATGVSKIEQAFGALTYLVCRQSLDDGAGNQSPMPFPAYSGIVTKALTGTPSLAIGGPIPPAVNTNGVQTALLHVDALHIAANVADQTDVSLEDVYYDVTFTASW